jgi:hypothetical protein
MASECQNEANRANALKSTGPLGPEGRLALENANINANTNKDIRNKAADSEDDDTVTRVPTAQTSPEKQ